MQVHNSCKCSVLEQLDAVVFDPLKQQADAKLYEGDAGE